MFLPDSSLQEGTSWRGGFPYVFGQRASFRICITANGGGRRLFAFVADAVQSGGKVTSPPEQGRHGYGTHQPCFEAREENCKQEGPQAVVR